MYFNPLKVFYPVAGVVASSCSGSLYYDVFHAHDLADKSCSVRGPGADLSIGLLADLIEKRSRL
jgi:hypothetical protein